METAYEAKKRHYGYNVKRLHEILGVKQEDLAKRLDTNQQAISRYENSETLEDDVLEKIAVALNVPVDAIKNFSEDAAVNFVANTFHDSSSGIYNFQCSFNPIDKVVELYERML